MNGSRTWVTYGTNIGGLIRQAQARQSNLLAKLTVDKLYNGKPVKVEFDRASSGVLNLIVSGGEVISWK